MQEAYREFGDWVSDEKLPIVYHEGYNMKFFGVEKLLLLLLQYAFLLIRDSILGSAMIRRCRA